MDNKIFILGLLGLIAGVASIRAYNVSGLIPALASILISVWLLFNIWTAENILNALGTLMDPFHSAISFLLIGFLYGALEGNSLFISSVIAISSCLIGATVSMWLHKYWTIGSH